MSETEVLELLKETAILYKCAQAAQGVVEIVVYGSRYSVLRRL